MKKRRASPCLLTSWTRVEVLRGSSVGEGPSTLGRELLNLNGVWQIGCLCTFAVAVQAMLAVQCSVNKIEASCLLCTTCNLRSCHFREVAAIARSALPQS